MSLYQEFIDLNPKNARQVINFLIDNCKSCRDALFIFIEIEFPDQLKEQKQEQFIKQKNKISLNNLNLLIKDFNLNLNCEGCDLCDIKIHRQKRKAIKNLINELDDIQGDILLINLNQILLENLDIKLILKKIKNKKYIYKCKFKNLYQYIIFDLVEQYNDKLNIEADLRNYFTQIAKILISTKKFVTDIKKIRNTYMENHGEFYWRKENLSHKDIFNEIEKLCLKYKLSQRWHSWLFNILTHDIDRKPSQIYHSIPDGSILSESQLVNFGSEKILKNIPFIVGDETKVNAKNFEIIVGQPIDIVIGNNRRKPIDEFEKQLRWYKLYQEGNSYIDIFDYEIEKNIEDWKGFSIYRQTQRDSYGTSIDGRNEAYYETKAINRIKIGIKIIKDRIYKDYK